MLTIGPMPKFAIQVLAGCDPELGEHRVPVVLDGARAGEQMGLVHDRDRQLTVGIRERRRMNRQSKKSAVPCVDARTSST